jgi:RNA-binding protein
MIWVQAELHFAYLMNIFQSSGKSRCIFEIDSNEISGSGGPMKKITSTQAKYLRGIAHGLKPVVYIGQKGLSDALIRSTEDAFDSHELIKIKFIDHKEKKLKTEIARALEGRTESHLAGMVGHIAIFYRQHPDPDKRKIVLPQ